MVGEQNLLLFLLIKELRGFVAADFPDDAAGADFVGSRIHTTHHQNWPEKNWGVERSLQPKNQFDKL